MSEPPTTTGALARLGFSRTDRVQRFLAEPALEGLGEGGAEAIGATADGDDAVLGLLRLAEAAQSGGHDALLQEFLSSVGEDGSPGHRLITLLGTSVALGDFLARHPEQLEALRSDQDALKVPASQVREDLLRAVGADPDADVPVAGATGREARDALRVAYHARLLQIAAADVSAEDPTEVQPAVSQSLSDLADAALDAGAAASRAAVDDHERVRWTVIAMGKTDRKSVV